MNSRIKKSLSGSEARAWVPRFLGLALLAFGVAGATGGWLVAGEEHASEQHASEQHAAPDLTVHEWGTLTAIAVKDGRAVEWLPLTGSTDLPQFVAHLGTANLKPGLRGTIRMETPVLYFYSPRDVTVSVKVAFSQGLISEWYPHAARVTPSG